MVSVHLGGVVWEDLGYALPDGHRLPIVDALAMQVDMFKIRLHVSGEAEPYIAPSAGYHSPKAIEFSCSDLLGVVTCELSNSSMVPGSDTDSTSRSPQMPDVAAHATSDGSKKNHTLGFLAHLGNQTGQES